MITLNKLEDLKPYYVEEVTTYVFNDDIEIKFSLDVRAHIDAWNIKARDINAWNIKARDIKAWDIKAGDINAGGINALNINARDINAWDINAWDINAGYINARVINAWDISAGGINARDILYYAVCFAYKNIECTSIQGRRESAKHFILDGEIVIKSKEQPKKAVTLELTDEQIEKVKELLEAYK